MVARDGSAPPLPDPRGGGLLRRWLGWWQHVLARALDATSNAASAVARGSTAALDRWRKHVASGGLTDVRRRSLAWLGVCAVFVGAVVGVAIASPGLDRAAAALAGAASLMWMGIRWLVMRLTAPRLLAEDPSAVRGAFSLGLLAYAAAVTPELRFAAWLASGALTAVMLVRLGRSRKEIARAVGFAWGAQALVVTGGWLARNAFVAILALRG